MYKIKMLGVVMLAVMMIFAAGSAFAQDNAITIVGMAGQVSVKIAPSADWVEAKVGMMLKAKDEVKTGEKGVVIMELPSKSSVSLKPNSQAVLDELVYEAAAKKIGVNMSVGEIRVIIDKVDSPSEFVVKTPTAISGARGTTYFNRTSIANTIGYCHQGAFDFSNANGGNGRQLGEKKIATAGSDGNVTDPRDATPEEIQSFLEGWDILIGEPYLSPVREKTEGVDAPNVTPERPTTIDD